MGCGASRPSVLRPHLSHGGENVCAVRADVQENVNGYASVKDKVALITGASSGIGRAIALELAHRGASVVVNYIGEPDRAREVVQEIEGEHGIALPVEADVSISDQVSRMMSE